MNLTEKSLLKLPTGKERAQFYDDEVRGFGVRIDPNGRKSFFWRAKIRGAVRFRALGEFPSISAKDARTAARRLIGVAAAWKQSGFAGPDPFAKEARVEPASVPTFKQLLDAYVERHVKETANHPERAEYAARWTAKKYFADWTERPIDEITVEDVLTAKNACGQHKHQANRCVEFVRAVFNWAAKAEDGKINFWRVENPAKDISFHAEKPRERFLQPHELATFNETLKKESHRDLADFLTLAMNTGARRSDIFSMRWQDIEWEREVWRVPYPRNGEAYDVSLLPAARAVLKRRRAEILESKVYVFPGIGRTGHLMNLKKQWNQFRMAAKIPDVRLHDIRRTVGSYLAMAGINLPQIGAALGHRSLQSTAIYARLHDQAVRGAREAGQQKMIQLMKASTRRTKLAGKNQKLLGFR
jgi:integrase